MPQLKVLTDKQEQQRNNERKHISSVRLSVSPIRLGEEDETRVDAIGTERLDQTRYG